MSYQHHVLNGLFVIRWEEPQSGDPKRYAADLAAAHKKQGKKPVGLFIMPEGSPAPDEAFKKEQAAMLGEIMDHIDFAIAVFEGSGFATSLKRSALVAILLLSGKRQKIFVKRSVEEALVMSPPGLLSFDGAKALAQLRACGACEVPYVEKQAKSA